MNSQNYKLLIHLMVEGGKKPEQGRGYPYEDPEKDEKLKKDRERAQEIINDWQKRIDKNKGEKPKTN